MSSHRPARFVLSCALLLAFSLSACGPKTGSSSLSSSSRPGGAGRETSAQSAPAENASPSPAADQESFPSEALSSPETAVTLIRVRTGAAMPLFSEDGAAKENAPEVPGGQELLVSPTGDPLWYAATLEDGSSGLLYAENLYPAEGTGSAQVSLFEEYAAGKFTSLKEQYPDGKYWNHMGQDIPYGDETPGIVTDIPCEHSAYGETYCNFYNGKTKELFPADTLCQCVGFASCLSDQLFGTKAPLHIFYDYDCLRVGDHIRLHEYEHSMTVVEKTEDYVALAEVNEDYEDCLIAWGRQMTRWELEELSWDSEYISRYPLCPDGNGGFVPWDEETEPYLYAE